MELPQNPADLKLDVSERYASDIANAWGKPESVVKAALNEAFRAGAELDFDDQFTLAATIGILAGATHEAGVGPEVFTHYFVNDVLAGYLE